MKTFRKYILILLTCFYSMTLLAENKLGIIKDHDGYTNVRNGPGKEYEVLDTLYEDEFFYYRFDDDSEWANVVAWNDRQIEGYVHKSRIQEVVKLNKIKQKELIIKILKKQRVLANNFKEAYESKDSLEYLQTRKTLGLHSHSKYEPVLRILPTCFCSTNDTEVIILLFETMWANSGSASETPSFTLGRCFICNSDLIIQQLKKIDNTKHKKHIINHIEWGLLNHFSVDENGVSDSEEYNELKGELDSVF